MKKGLIVFLLTLSCLLIGTSNASAQEKFIPIKSNYNVSNPLSLNATRYNFEFTVPYGKTVTDMQANQKGSYKYFRIRLEKGTTGSDNIEFRVVGGYLGSNNNPVVDVTFGKGVVNLKSIPMIIDFKAPNAPTRSDATYTFNCNPNNLHGVSSDDYCIISSSGGLFGIQVYNGAIFGGTPFLYGGYSLEN